MQTDLLKKEIQNVSTIFSANHFISYCQVQGEDSAGVPFRYEFIFDNADPEFRAMLNDYGARKSLQLIKAADAKRGVHHG